MDTFRPDRVVCHSLANMLWFWHAQKHPKRELEKVLLVAPPARGTDIKAIDTFFPYPKACAMAKEALLVASDNDKYITECEALELQKELCCDFKLIKGAGHLNSESGYGAWPFAYDWITS